MYQKMKTIKKLGLALFLLISVSYLSCSQNNARTETSLQFESDIQDFMLGFLEATNVPSMGFAFHSDTVGTVMSVVGKADLEKDLPLELTTLYPIQSTTKFFLAIVTFQLIEEGKLTLETTIDRWFADIPNSRIVTIRHLLQHTSGYENYQRNTEFNDVYYSDTEKEYTRDDFIEAGLSMLYQPEKFGSHEYSNTNSLILANIIEDITKQKIGQEFRQRIFTPVKMNSTYYKPEVPNDTNQIIKCYQNGLPIDLDRINFKSNAAGGIISNLGDMMKFAHWVLDNGYHQSMSMELVDNFIADEHEFKYGLGLELITNMYGTTLLGHSGGNPGFIHEFTFSPETGEIIIFFFNKWPDESDYHFSDKLGAILQRYRYSE